MGHIGFLMTILTNVIGGRRVIDERNITLSKRELWSMINVPFSSLLRLWNNIFKAFGSLVVKH